jgi:hypothetical protein
MEEKPKRPWLRYSVKTLLIVVLVVSAWLAAQVNWLRNRRAAVEKYRTSLKTVPAPSDVFGTGELFFVAGLALPQPDAPFPLNLIGETGYGNVYLTPDASQAEVESIRRLFPEAEVSRR